MLTREGNRQFAYFDGVVHALWDVHAHDTRLVTHVDALHLRAAIVVEHAVHIAAQQEERLVRVLVAVNGELRAQLQHVQHALAVFVLGVTQDVVHAQAGRILCLLQVIKECLVNDHALQHVQTVEQPEQVVANLLDAALARHLVVLIVLLVVSDERFRLLLVGGDTVPYSLLTGIVSAPLNGCTVHQAFADHRV